MYIRKSTRTYKDKTYTNYLLVESVHTPKGPRQKTICSLGDLGPRPRADWLALAHKIEAALLGQGELIAGEDQEVAAALAKVRARRERPQPAPEASELIAVDPARVTTEHHREAGPVHVGLQFWRRLGLDAILAECGLAAATRRLACAITLNRLIAPAAEHAMPDWIRRTALGELLGADFTDLDAQPLYRTLDKLHPHRAAIEAALVMREQSLFNLDATVYLYDLTSTYFEGLAAANPKAKRGYSRDGRPDCKQIVVGLVVNRDGFPIAHESFAGNTQDGATLTTMLDRLAQRVGLAPGATIVVDRGLASAENLALIRARSLHYIVASRQPERTRWLAEFAEPTGFADVARTPSPRNPAQRKSRVQVKLVREGAETFVLCKSDRRAAKDRAIREKHEQRLVADLDGLAARIAQGHLVDAAKINQAIGRRKQRYPRVARYYRLAFDQTTRQLLARRDDPEIARAEALDGCYLLKTDRTDLSAEESWRIYSLLTRAEDAFRDIKSPLAERPIFHHLERRVDTHIFLCVLAFHLLVAIEKTLLDRGNHTSWAGIRDALTTHQICTIVLPTSTGATLRIRKASTAEPQHRELYDLLDIPSQIIAPTRAWTDPA